jgi:mono/diheme cytochrome c family protein
MKPMQRKTQLSAALAALCLATAVGALAAAAGRPHSLLHRSRQHPSDLEIGGELAGVPRDETRFVAYDDLLTLPQESYTVSDDTNFVGAVTIGGIPLDKLPALLGAAPTAAMTLAVCDDSYVAHYPAEYLSAHRPLLVLRVNGKPPAQWPLGSDGVAMGPYMISHPSFTPAFHVLAHADEAQVPWGVVRLDFRNQAQVYEPIVPTGPRAREPLVQQGYAIARQNCFRCHSRNGEGGAKSPRSWDDLAQRAAAGPSFFNTYVRTPKQLNPKTQMAASPQYDAATLSALRAYFTTFTETRP